MASRRAGAAASFLATAGSLPWDAASHWRARGNGRAGPWRRFFVVIGPDDAAVHGPSQRTRGEAQKGVDLSRSCRP